MTQPTATSPGPASAAFSSLAHPQRTGEYACGALGRRTPRPQDLEPSRDGGVMDKPGGLIELGLFLRMRPVNVATTPFISNRTREPVPSMIVASSALKSASTRRHSIVRNDLSRKIASVFRCEEFTK